jgi:hypothetical protein
MRALLAIIVVVCWHCSGAPTNAEQELSRIWRTSSCSVEERAKAINKCFTNGTPVAHIISILGTNYTVTCVSEPDWPPPSPEPVRDVTRYRRARVYRVLEFTFEEQWVILFTTAPLDSDPLAYNFVRAGCAVRTDDYWVFEKQAFFNPIGQQRCEVGSAPG